MSLTVAAVANAFANSTSCTTALAASIGDSIGVYVYCNSPLASTLGIGTVSDDGTSGGNVYANNNSTFVGNILVGSSCSLNLIKSFANITYTPPGVATQAGMFVWRITSSGIVVLADSTASITTSTTTTNGISTGSMAVTSSDGLLMSGCFCGTSGHLSVGTSPAMVSDGTFIFGQALAEHFATSGANPATFTDNTAGDTLYLSGLAFQILGDILMGGSSQ